MRSSAKTSGLHRDQPVAKQSEITGASAKMPCPGVTDGLTAQRPASRFTAGSNWSKAEISASAGGSLIRHRDGGNVFTSPWNQARAWTSLRLELGGIGE